MKVEIGSGYHPDMTYDIHVDVNPHCPHLEYIRSADSLDMFQNDTVEEIRACDVLEHFSYRDTLRVLGEWYRILKPGSKIFIQCPNGKLLAQMWLDNKLPQMNIKGVLMPVDFSASYWIMGGQEDSVFAKAGDDWRFNAHYTLFSPESLEFYLKQVGFTSVDIQGDGGSNLMCWAVK
jgi:ubiquinone/menaquinone biosynthesis C-methylase UbiE